MMKLGVLGIEIFTAYQLSRLNSSTGRGHIAHALSIIILHEVDSEDDSSSTDEAIGDPVLASTVAGDVGGLRGGGLLSVLAMVVLANLMEGLTVFREPVPVGA